MSQRLGCPLINSDCDWKERRVQRLTGNRLENVILSKRREATEKSRNWKMIRQETKKSEFVKNTERGKTGRNEEKILTGKC